MGRECSYDILNLDKFRMYRIRPYIWTWQKHIKKDSLRTPETQNGLPYCRIIPIASQTSATLFDQVMNCLSEFGFYSVYVGDGRTEMML